MRNFQASVILRMLSDLNRTSNLENQMLNPDAFLV